MLCHYAKRTSCLREYYYVVALDCFFHKAKSCPCCCHDSKAISLLLWSFSDNLRCATFVKLWPVRGRHFEILPSKRSENLWLPGFLASQPVQSKQTLTTTSTHLWELVPNNETNTGNCLTMRKKRLFFYFFLIMNRRKCPPLV